MLSHTRCTNKLRKPFGLQSQKYVCQICPILSVVNRQRSASLVFSCDTGTQDHRNRAGLREGKQVRTAPTAIGRSCTFSMLWVGEGVYCPFTHNAKRPRPPSEQLHNPPSTESYVTAGFKGCQSALYLVDWWTRDKIIDTYLDFDLYIHIGIKFSLFLWLWINILHCILHDLAKKNMKQDFFFFEHFLYISDNQYVLYITEGLYKDWLSKRGKLDIFSVLSDKLT